MNFGRFDVESTVKILSSKDGLKYKKAKVIEVTGNGWHTVDYKGKLYKYRTSDLKLTEPSPANVYQPFPSKPKRRKAPSPPKRRKAPLPALVPALPPNKPKRRKAPSPPVLAPALPPNKPKRRKAPSPPVELVRKLSNELDALKKEVNQLRKEVKKRRPAPPPPRTPLLTRVYRSISGTKKKQKKRPAPPPPPIAASASSKVTQPKSPLDILDEMQKKPNFLSQIKKGKQLKKTERQARKSKKRVLEQRRKQIAGTPTPTPTPFSPDTVSPVIQIKQPQKKVEKKTTVPKDLSFLEQIKGGTELKKVERKARKSKKKEQSALEKAVLARRQYIKETPEDEDDDEWEFGKQSKRSRRFSKPKITKKKTTKAKRKRRKSKQR